MNILGISAFYHDSAAALIKDGVFVAGGHEERFTRKRHDSSFPVNAAKYCLSALGVGEQIDHIAFYDDFSLKRERAIVNSLQFFPKSLDTLPESVANWGKYGELLDHVTSLTGWSAEEAQKKIFCTTHHMSHAASSYYASQFSDAAVLTIDGVGEFSTVTIGHGKNNKLELLQSIDFPHSLGLFYSALTYYLGFKVNSGEYKVMGLAPLGEPVYKDKILKNILFLKPDGSFELNLDYFRFHTSREMIREDKVEALLGVGVRKSSEPLEDKHKNLAASVQAALEEAVFNLARHVKKTVPSDNLCVAGGVGLNCSAFGKLRNQNVFKNIYVQPAAGDAGGALGAAYTLYNNYLSKTGKKLDSNFSVYTGPDINTDEAKKYFTEQGYPFEEFTDSKLTEYVSEQLAAGKYVGWCQGKMEWGPRALGSRSILASTIKPGVHRDLNLLVKKREDFRPFAPVVLEEFLSDLFQNPTASPYMILVFFLREALRKPDAILTCGKKTLSAENFRALKSAVIHRDWSARMQSINQKQNPAYYNVVRAYYERTGSPMLVNTSFNVRGEPIVCTFKEAYMCFRRANLDILVVNNLVLTKDRQPFIDPKSFQAFEPD